MSPKFQSLTTASTYFSLMSAGWFLGPLLHLLHLGSSSFYLPKYISSPVQNSLARRPRFWWYHECFQDTEALYEFESLLTVLKWLLGLESWGRDGTGDTIRSSLVVTPPLSLSLRNHVGIWKSESVIRMVRTLNLLCIISFFFNKSPTAMVLYSSPKIPHGTSYHWELLNYTAVGRNGKSASSLDSMY